MPREYMPKTWTHGRAAWNRTKALLADYDRLLMLRKDIESMSGRAPDGVPCVNGHGRPTEDRGIFLARINEDIDAIDQASTEIRSRLAGKVPENFKPVTAYFVYDYYNFAHTRLNVDDLGPSIRKWRRYQLLVLQLVGKKSKIIP